MKKQIVSTLLALCMLLCLVPTAAFAEESTETPPACSCETACTAESMNKECPVCGAEGASAENCAKYIKPADGAAAQPEEKVSDPQPEGKVSDPQPETALTALSGEGETPTASGAVTEVGNEDDLIAAIADSNVNTVKLTGDISISNSLTVKRTVALDLNGFVLKYQNDSQRGSVIVVENGGQLTIEDSNTSKPSHKFNPNGKLWVLDETSGAETVNGGVITGGTGHPILLYGSSYYYYGGGVYIAPGGQLTMTGGNIIGCSATYGGGVCTDSEQTKFSMSGGSIAGCVASIIGGGVRASGTFKMSDQAVIRSCTAESATQLVCGGGVYVNGSSSFEMSDTAIIKGCQAISNSSYSSNGGGVYVSSGSSFVMSDKAKIEDCQAIYNSSNSSKSSNGGGVFLANGTSLTLSDNAVIQNCKADNSVNPGGTYGGGVHAFYVREITLEDNARIVGCTAANGSGLYIIGSQASGYGKLFANGGSVDGDVVLGDTTDCPCTITGSGETVFNGKVTVTPGSTIESGKFNGEVINNGTITGGVFTGTVFNNGTITGGVFTGTVSNNGTITGNPTLITGSGTESDPYQISTAEGLKWFRNIVNGSNGQTQNRGACAELTADIDLNNDLWTPIGPGESGSYTGTFDGKGHTIKNLNVSSSETYVGLFGYIGHRAISNTPVVVQRGAVRNLTVVGKVTGTGQTGQSVYVGGIAGWVYDGLVANCANLCIVENKGGGYTGGIAGYVECVDGYQNSAVLISDCYNVGTITGANRVGGIAGGVDSFSHISNCYNAGQITGTYTGEIKADGSDHLHNCYYLSDTDTDPAARTAAEFADGTVRKLLKAGERDNNEDPWADECKYLDAAGKTLPVFNGQGYTHNHQSDKWEHNDTEHWQVCTCGAVFHKAAHSGGKATCKAKAVCEICKESYGSLDLNSHADLKHIAAKAATAAAEGNIEYWYCEDCDKYFSDAAAAKEITKADTVTAKLPPKITAGDGAAVTQGEKKELSFTSDASFADFLRVDLDGTTLDEKNYTKKEGSTIITLNRDFVATLSVGEHTLSIVSKSGTATAKFTVKAKPAETTTTQPTVTPQPTAQPTQTAQPQPTVQPVSPIPSTGDTANPALWFALLIVSGFALAAIFVLRRKANRK